MRTFNNFNGVYCLCVRPSKKSKVNSKRDREGSVFHFLNAWNRLVKVKSNLDRVDLMICILALYPGN